MFTQEGVVTPLLRNVDGVETDKRGQVVEVVSGALGDVSQGEDGAVGVELCVVPAALQVGRVSRFLNVGPQRSEKKRRDCSAPLRHSSRCRTTYFENVNLGNCMKFLM